jgi:6-pyruvoyltetrahydropterin/6-carboxytetrahydropterin synthase
LKLTVVKEFTFAAAHFLPSYPGKCANLHGHEWRVQVGYTGEINDETGMVADFSLIKHQVEKLMEQLDHKCLNDVHHKGFPAYQPTAERMLKWMVEVLPIMTATTLSFIRLYETQTSYAEWREE